MLSNRVSSPYLGQGAAPIRGGWNGKEVWAKGKVCVSPTPSLPNRPSLLPKTLPRSLWPHRTSPQRRAGGRAAKRAMEVLGNRKHLACHKVTPFTK